MPAAKRDNLVLLSEATAREIFLEKKDSDWIAKGVRFEHKRKEYTVRVSAEIVLSAGSVQSPQLLELSGIGNPKILKAAGIDVKIENPNVGENLQEHICKIQCLSGRFTETSFDEICSNDDGVRDRSFIIHC